MTSGKHEEHQPPFTESDSLRFCFVKAARLLTSSDFKRVFDAAQVKVSHQHLLILASPNTHGQARLGIVVAKKNIRKANRRNRVKRHVRESFRLLQHTLPELDAIVLARSGLDTLDDTELNQLLTAQWQRLVKMAKQQTVKQAQAKPSAPLMSESATPPTE